MLSVIIPAFNAEGTLSAQLKALSSQTYSGEWELIIADNGSTDGTASLAERFKGALPLTVIDASHERGAAAARNAGVAASKGQRVIFCDADDVVSPTWLAAHAEDGFTTGPHVVFYDEFSAEGAPEVTASSAGGPVALGANLGIERAAFDSVGGFDSGTIPCEDADLSWRLTAAGWELKVRAEALIYKRERSRMIPAFKQYVGYGRGTVRLARRHRINNESWRTAARGYAFILLGVPLVWRRAIRREWARALGFRCGRVIERLAPLAG